MKPTQAFTSFFCHSDFVRENDITTELATNLINEIEPLLPALYKMGLGNGNIKSEGGYGNVARKFIQGCRDAILANEPLVFGYV